MALRHNLHDETTLFPYRSKPYIPGHALNVWHDDTICEILVHTAETLINGIADGWNRLIDGIADAQSNRFLVVQ